MIYIEQSDRYDDNAGRVGDGMPCVICGKEVKTARPKMIHTWEGAYAVTEDEVPSLDPAGESGFYPIGADCLRKHPELAPYVVTEIPQ